MTGPCELQWEAVWQSGVDVVWPWYCYLLRRGRVVGSGDSLLVKLWPWWWCGRDDDSSGEVEGMW